MGEGGIDRIRAPESSQNPEHEVGIGRSLAIQLDRLEEEVLTFLEGLAQSGILLWGVPRSDVGEASEARSNQS
jgi:hypothetical protein